jgi:hypothetical protein
VLHLAHKIEEDCHYTLQAEQLRYKQANLALAPSFFMVSITEVVVQITRQADYAVRAVLYLAERDPGARVSTGQIARDQKIPLTFLAKIVSQLSAAGLLHTTRGARGGVTLARCRTRSACWRSSGHRWPSDAQSVRDRSW